MYLLLWTLVSSRADLCTHPPCLEFRLRSVEKLRLFLLFFSENGQWSSANILCADDLRMAATTIHANVKEEKVSLDSPGEYLGYISNEIIWQTGLNLQLLQSVQSQQVPLKGWQACFSFVYWNASCSFVSSPFTLGSTTQFSRFLNEGISIPSPVCPSN